MREDSDREAVRLMREVVDCDTAARRACMDKSKGIDVLGDYYTATTERNKAIDAMEKLLYGGKQP